MSSEEVVILVDPEKKLLKTGDLSSDGKVVKGGRVSLWKLCAATVCFAGVQFGCKLFFKPTLTFLHAFPCEDPYTCD
jgi:hypothetical protein